MELVVVISRQDFGFKFGKFAQDPAVQTGHLVLRNRVLGGIEIVEIGELVAQRVADGAVGFADFVDPFLAHHNIVAVILRSDPQAHHVRAIFFDVGLGGLRFFVTALALLAFGNFLTIGVHHEPVREDCLERRRAVARQRKQQRRLEPAAMLVAAFQIHVRLPNFIARLLVVPQFRPLFQDGAR